MNRGNWIKANVAKQGGCPKCSSGDGEICAICLQKEIIRDKVKNPIQTAIDKEVFREQKRKKIRAGWKMNKWKLIAITVLFIAWIIL